MKRSKGTPKKEIWQNHHTSYQPEVIVKVTRAEHFYLTRLNYFNALSEGFRAAVKFLIKEKPVKPIPL